MYKVWFAVEDRASVASLKKAEFGIELTPTWFPVTGDNQRPFPTLLQATQRSRVDLLFYQSHHQPLPALSILKQIPTVISLDAAPLRPFSRERNLATGNTLFSILNSKSDEKAERVTQSIEHAAGFVVWSEWAKRELLNNFKVSPEKIVVARTGVDLAEWDDAQEAFQVARRAERGLPERIRILFAADDFETLGGDVLLKVFKQYPELAELCELHFITSRASVATYLKELVPDLKLHLHVHPQHEPAELYLNSDLYVLPARQATSPSEVATALAAGLPVVASRVDGLNELIHDGQNGLLVTPGDENSLYQAINRLINDPELRNSLGQNARLEAEKQFDARHNSQQVINFLRQIVRRTYTIEITNPGTSFLANRELSFRF